MVPIYELDPVLASLKELRSLYDDVQVIYTLRRHIQRIGKVELESDLPSVVKGAELPGSQLWEARTCQVGERGCVVEVQDGIFDLIEFWQGEGLAEIW